MAKILHETHANFAKRSAGGIARQQSGFAGVRAKTAMWFDPSHDLFAESLNLGDRVVHIKQFQRAPKLKAVLDTFTAGVVNSELVAALSADHDFSVLGTNMTSALSTIDVDGGVRLTTAGASADQAIMLPSLSTIQSAWTTILWGTENSVIYQANIKTGSAVTAQIVWVGLKLTNTPTVATDDNQIFVRYEAGVSGGAFVVHWSIAGTDYSTVTTVLPAADTLYRIKIVIDENRCGHVYIDGEEAATTGALTNNIDLIPYIGIQASAVAAKYLIVRNCAISRKAA